MWEEKHKISDGNGRVVKQSNGLEFFYDHTGIAGVVYNNTRYIYRKDVQGNIVGILDNTGKVVVKYTYDAWGNHAVADGNGNTITDETNIGHINPFRYRGYYYDTETELYFLKTRYYDPEIGRFITIDSIDYLAPDTINGLNLYAYCKNNPIFYMDNTGYFAFASAIKRTFVKELIAGFDHKFWGRISLTGSVMLEQKGDSGIIYAFSDHNLLNQKDITLGLGLNLFLIGAEIGINLENILDVSLVINIGSLLSVGITGGASGATLSGGINWDNTNYVFSVGLGIGPLVVLGLAAFVVSTGGLAIPVLLNLLSSMFTS